MNAMHRETHYPAPASARAAWPRRAGQCVTGLVLGTERRRRIRLLQWLVACAVYSGSAAVMYSGIDAGWMDPAHLRAWSVFVASGLLAVYVALRTGWSERLRDPALTEVQIVMGAIAVDWGYLICGPVRTLALFPLLLILIFGAFSLHWRRILGLSVFALASLAFVMHVLARMPELRGAWPQTPLPVDRHNMVMMLMLVPALAVSVARLSTLRTRLREQKHELAEALAQVQRLASCDELTGLPNRRALLQRLDRAQQAATAGAPGFCIAIIDLDNFKQVNDRLGHARGDQLLVAFAERIAAVMRSRDLLGRWGGEEFLVVVNDLPLPAARDVIERLQQEAACIESISGPLTFSAGVAEYRRGENVLDTVSRADSAMYRAKHAGRDAVRIEQAPAAEAGAASG
jgi:diguanylate cyclase (GGDEF)-like protein